MSYEANKESVIKSAEALKDTVVSQAETIQRDAAKMTDSLSKNVSDIAGTVSGKLKAVGVDTDVMVAAAKDEASELQRMIGDEFRNNPMRSLGIAAVIGLAVGLLSTR